MTLTKTQKARRAAAAAARAAPTNRPAAAKAVARAVPKPKARQVSAPVAKGIVRTQNRPRMVTTPNGDCTITHREYLTDLTTGAGTPSAFNLTAFPLNPGLSQTFPWLSAIAQRFESYLFSKLNFVYETEQSSSLAGTLLLSVDYDASDAPPTSKQQAMAAKGSVRSPLWSSCTHRSVVADMRKQKSYFVRSGLLPANSDVKEYDTGNLSAITQGSTATTVVGELYVEYTVQLMTPQYESVGTAGTLTVVGSVIATPFLGGVSLGSIPITAAGQVLTFTGLVVGSQYQVSIISTGNTAAGFTVPVGWTVKTTAFGTTLATTTLMATANVANLTFVPAVNPGVVYLSVAQVPVSAL